MHVFYSDHFVLPLPDGHRFPMSKYALLHQRVLERQIVPAACVQEPHAAPDAVVALAHDHAYLQHLATNTLSRQEQRAIGFPWSTALVERERRVTGATIDAARAALRDGVAVNLAGGTHHAFRDHGAGYCVFNDVAVAALALLHEGAVGRVAIIDCDVHQGDGTAAILDGDDRVWTFSIHGAKNYPFRKQTSDLDIALPDGTTDDAYLDALRTGLDRSLTPKPDLALYVAGADPWEGDQLGRLALTKGGLRARDALVFDRCHAAGIAVAVTMAGGYARNVTDIVDIHAATVEAAWGRGKRIINS
jgi:acetoin utilization deacetylase AcuC-like enzyme